MNSYRIKYLGTRGNFHFEDVEAASADDAVRKFLRAHPGIALAQCIGVSP